MIDSSLYKNIMLLGFGIEACLDKKLIAPALVLIYSAIDTVGWLDSGDEYATRTSFIKWADNYLLVQKPLKCTAIELYAARCGLLHSFSADSRLTYKKKARRICYAWGSGQVQDLQRSIDLFSKSTELVAVHVNDLYESWRLGVLSFVEELEKEHERKLEVNKKAAKFFSELGLETVTTLIAKIDNTENN